MRVRQEGTKPEILVSNNRIKGDQDGDTVNDYTFDSSGNTTKQANGLTFTYDAENKQSEVKNSSNVTIGQYWYDGDGKRIKKYVPGTGETTIFVYDASGKMIGEYSTNLNSAPQVSYLTNDHLGSPRINTDQNGAVISRHDYHPFGEEITGGSRTSGLGYVADDNRKQFTGYERDDETGLDFAQARMYAYILGRFITSDPIYINGKRLADPQQLNLYIYVRNNPMIYMDPNGEELKISGDTDKGLTHLREILGTEDAASRITYDKEKGLSIDLKDIDLTKNEGAKLLNDLKASKNVYEFRISETVVTAGGERAVGDMVNLSNNDNRFTKDLDKPPTGVDGMVVIDPTRDSMLTVKGSEEKLPKSWTTSFHELAESYEKVDGSKQYYEAHAAANSREDTLRGQRPDLKGFMRGGGGPNLSISGDKLFKHRDKVNERLKKKN